MDISPHKKNKNYVLTMSSSHRFLNLLLPNGNQTPPFLPSNSNHKPHLRPILNHNPTPAAKPHRHRLFRRHTLENKLSSLLLQCGAVLATAEVPVPALAVTGENVVYDLESILISGGIIGFLYFIAIPPIIMNWLRLRWYKRNFVEMYFQFMFVFLFFPGLLLWAPFLNFRKFPRDPTMKYPWSTPKDDVPLYKER